MSCRFGGDNSAINWIPVIVSLRSLVLFFFYFGKPQISHPEGWSWIFSDSRRATFAFLFAVRKTSMLFRLEFFISKSLVVATTWSTRAWCWAKKRFRYVQRLCWDWAGGRDVEVGRGETKQSAERGKNQLARWKARAERVGSSVWVSSQRARQTSQMFVSQTVQSSSCSCNSTPDTSDVLRIETKLAVFVEFRGASRGRSLHD